MNHLGLHGHAMKRMHMSPTRRVTWGFTWVIVGIDPTMATAVAPVKMRTTTIRTVKW